MKLHIKSPPLIKFFLLTAILFIPQLLNAQVSGTYRIEGKLSGLGREKVYLSTDLNGQLQVDSTFSVNGTFSFKGKIPGTMVYGLRFGKNFLSLAVQPEHSILIDGDLEHLDGIRITGAEDQAALEVWNKSWKSITNRAGQLYKMLDSVGHAGDRSHVDAEFKRLDVRLKDSVASFIRQYPASPIAAYVIIDRFINYSNQEQAQLNYAALSDVGKNTYYGKTLNNFIKINAKTGIGVEPNFTMPDQHGKMLSLSALKGKIILVDFWASWCVPCRKENPNLVKAYADYHNRGFEILGVSLDTKKDSWIRAIQDDGLIWLQTSDLSGWKSELVEEYGIKSIPANFLLDADGKIIAKNLRGDDLVRKLKSIFK